MEGREREREKEGKEEKKEEEERKGELQIVRNDTRKVRLDEEEEKAS